MIYNQEAVLGIIIKEAWISGTNLRIRETPEAEEVCLLRQL